MFQLLPALILLILQGQGQAGGGLSRDGSPYLRAIYLQAHAGRTSSDFSTSRALLAHLLNGQNRPGEGQAFQTPWLKEGFSADETQVAGSFAITRAFCRPELLRLSDSQKLRDGPNQFASL